MSEIRQLNAQVVGISADSRWSHKAFANERNIDFPLLADWFGTIGRRYDVWNDVMQREHRVVMVVDSKGAIAYSRVYPDDELPDIREAVDVIQRLQGQEQKRAG
jgi:peroxiredoxin